MQKPSLTGHCIVDSECVKIFGFFGSKRSLKREIEDTADATTGENLKPFDITVHFTVVKQI